MMKKGTAFAICLMVAVAVVVEEAAPAEAVTCTATELSPCAGPLLSPGPPQKPSQECCNRLKEQEPCLCGYMKDPSLSPYINTINAGTVSATCGVPIPTC